MDTTVTSTEAKNRLNALLADIERTGQSVTITNHRRPVAKLASVTPVPRKLGHLPNRTFPNDFDEPLPESELARREGFLTPEKGGQPRCRFSTHLISTTSPRFPRC